ncbi:MAG: ATP-binding protein [Tannerella sp.]|jgi:predicted AAA+ superfamily ATPase|nr:ATP-binding protein [Tannerella sp.]
MKRKVFNQLVAWKNKQGRMPLIVNGARQIGKTFSISEFGENEFANTVYINLETNPDIRQIFEGDISPARIVRLLESSTNMRIIEGETLLFLDEIQASERALTSLKYFCEQAPQYYVVAAGSLLGVAINREKYSFPVGKIDEINMFPLDFEEFLWAMDREMLADEIKIHFAEFKPMPEILHKQALELYNYYCIIGGMPAVINDFRQKQSFLTIKDLQNRILNEYIADMSKYAKPATTAKIYGCYKSIPTQLAKENKKFQYKIVQKGGTATLFGEAIEWLLLAGITLKNQRLEHGFIPIKAYQNLSDFKLYMGDTGMLTMHSGLPAQMLLSSSVTDNTFMGGMAENFVAQQLAAIKIPLFYWKSEDTAEVDFVLQIGIDVVPVEVKKGVHTRSTSLAMFVKKYKSPYAIRISQKHFGFENNIKSIPFYALFCLNNY